MPELPDLQVFSKNLHKKLAGKKLSAITIPTTSKLNVSVKVLKEHIEGHLLDKVHRVGQRLHFNFNNGKVMAWHLMLHGEMMLYERSHEEKHVIIDLLFGDDTGLLLKDFQRSATIELDPATSTALDPLSKSLNHQFLKDALGKSKTTIKKLLMDQDIIGGIGNAYADEILWHAKLSPFSVCNKIPDQKIRALDKSIKATLEDAEKKIAHENPGIISGELRDFMAVHTTTKTKSPEGGTIEFLVTGGRKTYFTDEQELFN